MKTASRVLLLSCGLFFLHQVCLFSAVQPKIRKILRGLQNRYAKSARFEADFVQITENKRFGVRRSEGRVIFQKKGKMLWKYKSPEKKLIAADGSTLWIYDPEAGQVLINDKFRASQLPLAISLLWGEGDIYSSFDVKSAEEADGVMHIKLVPKERTPQVTMVELFVRTSDYSVLKTSLHDFQGTVNTLSFKNAVFGGPLGDNIFKFEIPKGAVVVHLDRVNFRF